MADEHIEQLRRHFAVGSIIYSKYWMNYDRVIAFNVPGINSCDYASWSVTVAECDEKGNVIGEEREHCTAPMPY